MILPFQEIAAACARLAQQDQESGGDSADLNCRMLQNLSAASRGLLGLTNGRAALMVLQLVEHAQRHMEASGGQRQLAPLNVGMITTLGTDSRTEPLAVAGATARVETGSGAGAVIPIPRCVAAAIHAVKS